MATDTISETRHRNRLGRFILISNIGFALLIVLFFLLGGFDNEEFTEIMKILIPIKSVYLTAFIKYVIANKNLEPVGEGERVILNPLYATTSFVIILTHISSLVICTTLYALFNIMMFDVLISVIIFIESLFGVYVGLFMASMFKVEEDK